MLHFVYPFISLMAIWVASTFWLLWVVLHWILVHKLLGGYIFNSLGIYPGGESPGHTIAVFNSLWSCQTVFQSHRTTFYSRQQRARFPIIPSSRQHLWSSMWCVCFVSRCRSSLCRGSLAPSLLFWHMGQATQSGLGSRQNLSPLHCEIWVTHAKGI